VATFVIVHGAWSGGHAWRWLRPLLRAAGHEVFTPALTGLGERSHLANAQIDLDTHVLDVVGVLEYEDLLQALLVGHSYGGMVITGVADRVPERLAQLVYLDAEVPMDGQSEFDLLPPEERAVYQESARSKGQGWRILPPLAGAAAGRPGCEPSLGDFADGAPTGGYLRAAAALDQPGGPRGVPHLCAVHRGQGGAGGARLRPARPSRPVVAVCRARRRTWRPRDRAADAC
jgi:pimeloyl-ACP methyl ester carboxylesterase